MGDPRQWTEYTPAAVTIAGSGNTTLITLNVKFLDRIFVQITNATQAFDAFIIAALANSNSSAAYQTLYNAAADFQTPSGLLIGTDGGDMTTLAAGSTGWFIMDVRGLYKVRLQASAAADSASATLFVGGN